MATFERIPEIKAPITIFHGDEDRVIPFNSSERLSKLLKEGFLIEDWIIGDGELNMSSDYLLGYSLAIACALIWSSYSWFVSYSDSHVEDIAWQSAAVSALSLIASYSLESPNWHFTANEWLGVLLLGLGPVGGSFYLWDLGLKRGNKQLLASLSFSAPLISSILLALAGISIWSINIAIALGLILLGAGIANFTPKHPRNTVLNTKSDMACKQ